MRFLRLVGGALGAMLCGGATLASIVETVRAAMVWDPVGWMGWFIIAGLFSTATTGFMNLMMES